MEQWVHRQLQHADGSSISSSDDGAAAPSNAPEPGTFQKNHQVAQIWDQLRNPTGQYLRGKAEDYALTECVFFLPWTARSVCV